MEFVLDAPRQEVVRRVQERTSSKCAIANKWPYSGTRNFASTISISLVVLVFGCWLEERPLYCHVCLLQYGLSRRDDELDGKDKTWNDDDDDDVQKLPTNLDDM